MFIPKNIDKRAEDLKKIQVKDLKEYDVFVKGFKQNLDLMKDKTSDGPKEQLFIDLIQDCDIKLDQNEYPFRIFLFKNDKYMFEYDWKIDEFYCSYDSIWKVFESKFNMSYQEWQHFISDQIETYFKFRPSTTFALWQNITSIIETYFKFRPSTTLDN